MQEQRLCSDKRVGLFKFTQLSLIKVVSLLTAELRLLIFLLMLIMESSVMPALT